MGEAYGTQPMKPAKFSEPAPLAAPFPAEPGGGATLPTQLPAFRDAVTETFLADAILRPVTVRSGDGAEASLPLCRARGPFARWRVVGSREVFEPVDAQGEPMDLLARELASDARPLDFDRVPANSPLVPALAEAMRGHGWLVARPAQPRPLITLPPDLADPLVLFNAGRRSDFRRAQRKAERHGAVACEILSPTPAEFDALFDEAIAVESHSWKRAAGSALEVDRSKQDFFRRFLGACCGDGLTRIAFLRIAGQPAAMQLALEWRERFWLFKIGYDEAWRDCSPGNLLMLHTLEYAARKGLRSYELLGNVERWIALLWTGEQLPCLRLRTYPRSLRGLVALAGDGCAAGLAKLRRGEP